MEDRTSPEGCEKQAGVAPCDRTIRRHAGRCLLDRRRYPTGGFHDGAARTLNTTAAGSYYSVNGDVKVVQARPIVPRVSINVGCTK